jgi:hypothetical protein
MCLSTIQDPSPDPLSELSASVSKAPRDHLLIKLEPREMGGEDVMVGGEDRRVMDSDGDRCLLFPHCTSTR